MTGGGPPEDFTPKPILRPRPEDFRPRGAWTKPNGLGLALLRELLETGGTYAEAVEIFNKLGFTSTHGGALNVSSLSAWAAKNPDIEGSTPEAVCSYLKTVDMPEGTAREAKELAERAIGTLYSVSGKSPQEWRREKLAAERVEKEKGSQIWDANIDALVLIEEALSEGADYKTIADYLIALKFLSKNRGMLKRTSIGTWIRSEFQDAKTPEDTLTAFRDFLQKEIGGADRTQGKALLAQAKGELARKEVKEGGTLEDSIKKLLLDPSPRAMTPVELRPYFGRDGLFLQMSFLKTYAGRTDNQGEYILVPTIQMTILYQVDSDVRSDAQAVAKKIEAALRKVVATLHPLTQYPLDSGNDEVRKVIFTVQERQGKEARTQSFTQTTKFQSLYKRPREFGPS